MLLEGFIDTVGGWTTLGIAAAVLFGLVFFLMLAKQYKRCPSNKVLVIYGRVKSGTSAKCLHGGGAFVMPLVQSYDYLHLDPIQAVFSVELSVSQEVVVACVVEVAPDGRDRPPPRGQTIRGERGVGKRAREALDRLPPLVAGPAAAGHENGEEQEQEPRQGQRAKCRVQSCHG